MDLNFLLDSPGVKNSKPAITQHGFDDLGDDPSKHRWRAFWEGDGINLQAFPILKQTACGVWICNYSIRWNGQWDLAGPKRFIHNKSGQGYAKPTREEAMYSLAVRLTRWTNNIRRETERAEASIAALRALRPDLSRFADTAEENLKGEVEWRA